MTLDEILSAEPTLSENSSGACFAEILHHEGWRCYSSALHPETQSLIERYLRAHAQIPGMVTERLNSSSIPLELLRFPLGDTLITGALYLNGAVVALQQSSKEVYLLFVEDATANHWGYPKEFRTLSAKTVQE